MTTSNKKINNKNSNKNLPVVKEGELLDNNVLINSEEQIMQTEIIEETNIEGVDINEDVLDKSGEESLEEPVDFEVEVKKLIEEMGYEQIFAKLTTVQSVAKSGSKMEKCVDIYKEMIVDEKNRRIDIINAFVSQQGISKEHASTYFQTIRTRLKKATGQ